MTSEPAGSPEYWQQTAMITATVMRNFRPGHAVRHHDRDFIKAFRCERLFAGQFRVRVNGAGGT